MSRPTRYRFAGFLVSPRQRALLHDGREVPLIPRYFDLLVLLLERRHEAVARQEIFARVWNDVVVSDGALTQAIRTLRRTLGDDSREPRFIRTVSRHGYRFVCTAVVEEPDERPVDMGAIQEPDARDGAPAAAAVDEAGHSTAMVADALVDVLTSDTASYEERRDAAERLHALGTDQALAQLARRPRNPTARALLRDARWDVPGAGPVPLLGAQGGAEAALALARLRLRQAWRLAERRWIAASVGGGLAGVAAGAAGGLLLALMPGGEAPLRASAVLAGMGGLAGAVGAAGIGAGLAAAESLARSHRSSALVTGGALGGGLIGIVAHLLVRWTLDTLFGLQLPRIAGPLEGFVLGAAAGLGYALATLNLPGGGMATPRGRRRLLCAAAVAACCAIAALALSATGRPMVGGLVHEIAQASRGARLALSPLGRLIGEPEFGPLTAALIGAGEGALFGCGLALGLTRRPSA